MRLTIISSSFPPYTSGVATNAVLLANGLAARNHQVNVITSLHPQPIPARLIHPKVKLTYLSSCKTPLKKNHYFINPFNHRVVSALDTIVPDLIHLQEPSYLFYQALRWIRIHRIPLVMAHHFPPEFVTNQIGLLSSAPLLKTLANRSITRLAVSVYNHADHIVTPTFAMRRLLLDSGLKTPVSVISNGVDISLFTPGRFPKSLPPIILYFGRVDPDKNLDVLVKAFTRITLPGRLVIAGDGATRPRLEKLALSSPKSSSIQFLGYVPEKDKVGLYQKSSIFAVPSTSEAQSITSLQAAACGLPLVLANAAALPELIDGNGYLFHPGNQKDLAAKISLLLKNPKDRNSMGQKSRLLAEKHDLDQTILDYEKLYLSLIN